MPVKAKDIIEDESVTPGEVEEEGLSKLLGDTQEELKKLTLKYNKLFNLYANLLDRYLQGE